MTSTMLIQKREQLLQQIEQLKAHIENIDTVIKFFDEHPEIEMVMRGMMALQSLPGIGTGTFGL